MVVVPKADSSNYQDKDMVVETCIRRLLRLFWVCVDGGLLSKARKTFINVMA
jgi:hypothetical protein